MLRTLLAAALLTSPAFAAPPIAPRLTKGVNLSHWWSKPFDMDKPPEQAVTDADLSEIRRAGFMHVRIPVDPALLADGSTLNQARVEQLTRSLARVQGAGLTAVVAVTLSGSKATGMDPARNPDGWERELSDFWTLLAGALRQQPADRLAVELLSGPSGFKDDAAWPAAQERLRAAVRAVLPRHTIILTGDAWSEIDALTRLKASPDPNVVYSFHFYDPHAFTHQGADWGAPVWKSIKDLRYPFNAANTDAALAAVAGDGKARSMIEAYAREKWDAPRVAARIKRAKAWADAQKPPATLYLGEFGAYRAGCDAPSRSAWTADARTAAENAGVGWCVFDWSGAFAMSERVGKDRRRITPDAATALGLAPPATNPARRRAAP